MEPALSSTAPLPLSDRWTWWSHAPTNPDYSLAGYVRIQCVSTLPELIALVENVPPVLVERGMLFWMRGDITPRWEDPRNREGGFFAFRVDPSSRMRAWKALTYTVLGGTLSAVPGVCEAVTGVTLSPKKKHHLLKIWMGSKTFQCPTVLAAIPHLSTYPCVFGPHDQRYANNHDNDATDNNNTV